MGGKSRSSQTQEGDVIFNNIDYGQGGGGGALKNFNVGRDNTLEGNVFNITDGGAVESAIAGSIRQTEIANETIQKGAAYSIGANEAIAGASINAGTTSSLINAELSNAAMDKVTKAAAESIKAQQAASAAMAKNASQFGSQISSLAGQSTAGAYNFANSSLNQYADIVSMSNQQNDKTLSYAQNATGKAMDYVFKSTQSASERTSDNILKYSGYAAAAVGSLVLLSFMRGR